MLIADITSILQPEALKMGSAIVAGVASLIGIPLAIQQFRKTGAEIRKLRLEADALEQRSTSTTKTQEGVLVNISGSPMATVIIKSDPRLRIPLLALLDFALAYILISLLSYALSVISISPFDDILRVIAALALFGPVARQIQRAKKASSEPASSVVSAPPDAAAPPHS